MKEWKCIQTDHHDSIGGTVESMEKDGWSLHTYAPSQVSNGRVNHYLLFEREKK